MKSLIFLSPLVNEATKAHTIPTLNQSKNNMDEGKIVKTHKGEELKVSDEDFEWASQYKWYRSGSGGYPMCSSLRSIGGGALHREVIKRAGHNLYGMVVDHVNGDKRDARRSQLRVCTQLQNTHNRLGYQWRKSQEVAYERKQPTMEELQQQRDFHRKKADELDNEICGRLVFKRE
jgi:HNH endonuclease